MNIKLFFPSISCTNINLYRLNNFNLFNTNKYRLCCTKPLKHNFFY